MKTQASALTQQSQKRSLVVIGGALGDIVLTLNELPHSGQDVVACAKGQQIGGCAFNIARVLRKLDFNVINGIPVGSGSWGILVEQEMNRLDLPILLKHKSLDNGWCLALVEPSGERTFITVEGCETDWSKIDLSLLPIENDSIIYVSGYELVGDNTHNLRDWLLALPQSVLIFVDLGPRIVDVEPLFLNKLLTKNILLTLNRDEIALLCQCNNLNLIESVQKFVDEHHISIIARLDCHGAWLCQYNQSPVFIAANEVEVVDTIGAGDSHCGGVIAGLAVGYPLVESIRLGNQIAAVVVNRRGANNPPTRKELADFKFVEKRPNK